MVANTIPLEEHEQRAVVQWLRAMRIPCFATLNHQQMSGINRRAAAIIQGKQKALGMQPGVYDLCVFLPNKFLHIELKRQKGVVVSNPQKIRGAIINRFPYAEAIVCTGADEAIQAVKERL